MIEEAIGCRKVIDSDEPQPPSGGISFGGKLHLTQEQWEARCGEGKKGEPSSSTGGRKRGKLCKGSGGTQAGARERAEGGACEGAQGGTADRPKAARDDACHNCGRPGHLAKDCSQRRRGSQAHIAEA